MTFGTATKIRFGADSSIGASNITRADQFQFVAVGVPAEFEWVVLSSSNANVQASGNSFTVSGTGTDLLLQSLMFIAICPSHK